MKLDRSSLSLLSLIPLLFFLQGAMAQNGHGSESMVLRIGDDEISERAFETIYFKNNKDSAVTEEALRDYMDLFIDFKLKVKEAEKRGLDTTRKFQREFENYKKQLARPYLIDSTAKQRLLKEAYERTKTQVHASHILVSPSDKLTRTEAEEKAKAIKERIAGSDSSFLELGKQIAQKEENVRASDLGYFDAFRMVYPFEDAAYNTDPGSVSDPVRTEYGYHLIKVHDKRPSRGRMKVAHIMKHAPKKASPEKRKKAETKIQDLHEKLQNGSDFHRLARKFSDDRRSSRKGGRLSWFGYGDMTPKFSEAAFSLDSNGAISEPVRTRYGWHLIKRLDHKPMKSFEEMRPKLERKLKKSDRFEKVREARAERLAEEYDLQVKEKRLKELAHALPENGSVHKDWTPKKKKKDTDPLFSFADTSFGSQELVSYIQGKEGVPRGREAREKWVGSRFDSLTTQLLLDHERSKLKEKYPRYRALLQEYRDGILLFELMEKKVWNKALEDTVGLREFYEKNKTDYKWDERVAISYFECKEQEAAERVQSMLEEGSSPKDARKRMHEGETLKCRLDSGAYEKDDFQFLESIEWEEGVTDLKVVNDRFLIGKVHEILPPRTKKLEEARGLVSSDYQDHLEERWVEELREKYEIEVHDEVLRSLAQEHQKEE